MASPPSPPPIQAYWFYSSPFPLDDPLAPFPIPTAATAAIKHPPRPFARYDSRALEAAYQDLMTDAGRVAKEGQVVFKGAGVELTDEMGLKIPSEGGGSPRRGASNELRGMSPGRGGASQSRLGTSPGRGGASQSRLGTSPNENMGASSGEPMGSFPNERLGAGEVGSGTSRLGTSPNERFGSSSNERLSFPNERLGTSPGRETPPNERLGTSQGTQGTPPNIRLGTSPNERFGSQGTGTNERLGTSPNERFGSSLSTVGTPPNLRLGTSPGAGLRLGTSPNRSGTTRTPFIRSLTQSRASTFPASRASSVSRKSSVKKSTPPPSPLIQTEIPVGIQRLHQVLLPSFIMTPIYWPPLQDVASVMRGTWFYGETMLPVDAETANRLEAGWEEVRAWTEEWEMELASAVEVGREGEEKVRWKLWANDTESRPGSALGEGSGDTGGFDSVQTKAGVTGGADPLRAGVGADAADWVLFANGTDAYICRDTMLSFGNKRPLANIRRGRLVGTHVVRGFQQDVWERLNPSTKKRKVPASGTAASGRKWNPEKRRYSHAKTPSVSSAPGTPGSSGEETIGLGPDDDERIPVTDLFLVIHGIGQKLSERVESFHFTHAINSFRRHINVELKDPAVRPHLRDGGKVGMMVLPVNWRHNLSFEEGIPDSATSADFTLSDITPPSIPAVRNLIGDVMLDIPYYLSHHKQKMIRAVVKEANRVWRLWCANNPGFAERGRVHIIAHSLGTAIAMDILSQQPTSLRAGIGARVGGKDSSTEDWFEFDTKNVFFVGSPAGFFLLLNKRILLPRRGRNKTDCDASDKDPGVTGEVGTYGCMAADNIYNVLHQSDPIAYRLNPTVDVTYAASLRTAYVPSTATTFLDALSSTFRSVLPSPSQSSTPGTVPAPPQISRLPSTIELETHDFSREELAEQRLYLLNDNGQIDWFLQEGQGALENQYLNMLGAHSSYWESRDFVRFCVVEAGRRGGRGGVVKGMSVGKKRGWK